MRPARHGVMMRFSSPFFVFFLSIFAMNHPRSPFLVIPVDQKLWTESVLYVLFGKGRLALPEHEGKRVYEGRFVSL